MAAEPRDGRWQNLKADHDFTPAPDLEDLDPGEVTPGVFLQQFIDVWVDEVPHSPAYFGFGQFQFPTGTNQQLQVTPTLQVYRVISGELKVTAGGPGHSLAQGRLRQARRGPGRRRRVGDHTRPRATSS